MSSMRERVEHEREVVARQAEWLRSEQVRSEEEATAKFSALPLAGHTQQCPKCLFGMLTYRYQTCHLFAGFWCPGSGSDWGAFRFYQPTRALIVRHCPQCGADTFERPADSVTDYEDEAA